MVVQSSLIFHPSCRNGCMDRAKKYNNKTTQHRIVEQVDIFRSCAVSDHQRGLFVALCSEAGKHLFKFGGDTSLQQCGRSPSSFFLLPLSSRSDAPAFCLLCFQANLHMSRSGLRGLISNAPIMRSPLAFSLSQARNYLSLKVPSTPALVVSYNWLLKFPTVVILEDPILKYRRTVKVGIIEYNNLVLLHHGETCVPRDTLCIGDGSVIATRKSELRACIANAKGQLDLNFVHVNGQCDGNEYVVLCIAGSYKPRRSDFHPLEDDFSLFRSMKKSVVESGNHFGSQGYSILLMVSADHKISVSRSMHHTSYVSNVVISCHHQRALRSAIKS